MHFGVRGWSPKIDIDIFEEPKNHRVILQHKVCKKMNITNSKLWNIQGGDYGKKPLLNSSSSEALALCKVKLLKKRKWETKHSKMF